MQEWKMREQTAGVFRPTICVDNAIVLITSKTQKPRLCRPACLALCRLQELYRRNSDICLSFD